MPDNTQHPTINFCPRRLLAWLLILYLAISGLFYAYYENRVQHFLANEREKAELSVYNAARSIQQLLAERRRILKAYLNDHRPLIEQLIKTPDDDALEQRLRANLSSYFPDVFGINIYDARQHDFLLLTDTFAGRIERICLQDTRTFSQTGQAPLRIHPNVQRHHYDLYFPLSFNRQYIFFASFGTQALQQTLATAQLKDHHLMLVLENKQGTLIELTPEGDRQALRQHSHHTVHLTPSEQTNILARHPIPGTRWQAIDLFETPERMVIIRTIRDETLQLWLLTSFIYLLLTTLLWRTLTAHHRQVLEIEQLNRQLQELATHDPLTSLHNRRYFDEALQRAWNYALRHGHPISLMMIDIDHFKVLNDRLGHQQGDQTLQAVARHLRQHLRRASDIIARYGGEEFAVILPDTPPEAACELAEQLRQSLLQQRLPHPTDTTLTLSIGVAGCHPTPDKSPQQLIRVADEQLYRAKTEGRNRVCCIQTRTDSIQ